MNRLAYLLLVAALYGAPVVRLACVIEGEAGICGRDAKVAVARVYQVNPTMYGWALPSDESLDVAMNWESMEDTAPGAAFAFSDADLESERVRAIIEGRPLVRRFVCAVGGLNVY